MLNFECRMPNYPPTRLEMQKPFLAFVIYHFALWQVAVSPAILPTIAPIRSCRYLPKQSIRQERGRPAGHLRTLGFFDNIDKAWFKPFVARFRVKNKTMYWIATVAFGRPRNDKDMESFGLQQNKESAPERESFDVEKGLSRERTILGRFRGKAKDIGGVLLLVSALSAGMAKEGFAERKRMSNIPPLQPIRIEMVKNDEASPHSFGEVLNQKVVGIYKHLNEIKNNEDAERFLIEHFDDFIYTAVRGYKKIEKENVQKRDFLLALHSMEEMQRILTMEVPRRLINEKTTNKIPEFISLDRARYERRIQQIDDTIAKFKLSNEK